MPFGAGGVLTVSELARWDMTGENRKCQMHCTAI
jgi:hypothetical protein